MPYMIQVFDPDDDPTSDDPIEVLGPFVKEEAVARRFSELVASEASSGALRQQYRITEVGIQEPESADEHDGEGDLPVELMVLLQLDPHGEGTIPAALAADICGRDAERILGFIHTCELQTIEWRQAGRDAATRADPDEAEASFHEAESWNQTTSLLRAALRVVHGPPPEDPSRE